MTSSLSKADCVRLEMLKYIGAGGGGGDAKNFILKKDDSAINLTLEGKTTIAKNDEEGAENAFQVDLPSKFSGEVQFTSSEEVNFSYTDKKTGKHQKSAKEIMENLDGLNVEVTDIKSHEYVEVEEMNELIGQIRQQFNDDEAAIEQNTNNLAVHEGVLKDHQSALQTHETKIASMESDIEQLKKDSGGDSGGGGGGLDPDDFVSKTEYDTKMTAIDSKTATYDDKLADVEIKDLVYTGGQTELLRHYERIPVYSTKGFKWLKTNSNTVYTTDRLSQIYDQFDSDGNTLITFTMKYKKKNEGVEEPEATGAITANTLGQKMDEFTSKIDQLIKRTCRIYDSGDAFPTFELNYHPIKDGEEDTSYQKITANQIGQKIELLDSKTVCLDETGAAKNIVIKGATFSKEEPNLKVIFQTTPEFLNGLLFNGAPSGEATKLVDLKSVYSKLAKSVQSNQTKIETLTTTTADHTTKIQKNADDIAELKQSGVGEYLAKDGGTATNLTITSGKISFEETEDQKTIKYEKTFNDVAKILKDVSIKQLEYELTTQNYVTFERRPYFAKGIIFDGVYYAD